MRNSPQNHTRRDDGARCPPGGGGHLDIDSSEALEQALEGFEGTVVAVWHDRAFLRRLDRFLMVLHDGSVIAYPDPERALHALALDGTTRLREG